MTRYVCGFMFDNDRSVVALIKKKRPAWQAGKRNGIGGHIEAGETPLAAMRREFFEETGVAYLDWEQFTTLRGDGFEVVFFRAFTNHVFSVQSMTDEQVSLVPPRHLLLVIPNLRWLIPMALHECDVNYTIEQAA
jgi:8-oxo-dGTP diphosphatase